MATGKPDAWSLFLTAHALVVEEIESDCPPRTCRRWPGTTRCGRWNARRKARRGCTKWPSAW